jgi:predicted transcriptional regulator
MKKNKHLEPTIREILKSRAQSRIYIYLLRKNGAKTEEIIRGTKLHPSTVRETLSKMNSDKLIIRKKQKNDSIGKNPYLYYPLPPIQLVRKYANEIEDRLNKLATFSNQKNQKNSSYKLVKINILEREDSI